MRNPQGLYLRSARVHVFVSVLTFRTELLLHSVKSPRIVSQSALCNDVLLGSHGENVQVVTAHSFDGMALESTEVFVTVKVVEMGAIVVVEYVLVPSVVSEARLVL